MKAVHCAAVDLGASSGRVIVGSWVRGRLALREVHRFPVQFRSLGERDYWDLPTLWSEVRAGLVKARLEFPGLASVGVDTWGVDYALVDRAGALVYPVHAYRDRRTQPGLRRLARRGLARIYAETGVPNVFYNTSLQLEAMLRLHPGVRETADRCLFLPDYFNFLLSGWMENEVSISSTSQLLGLKRRTWSGASLRHFGIPGRWFRRPVPAATRLGTVASIPELKGVGVIAVPGHDTACAYDAMPADPSGTDLFISSGTWSLVGFESPRPLVGAEALKARISNERTGRGGFRPLTNVIGLWLLERTLVDLGCRPETGAGWEELLSRAGRLPAPRRLLDVSSPAFANPASMRREVDAQLRGLGQTPPRDAAGYARLICDSLGAGHAEAARTFERLSGKVFRRILIVGGGSKNPLLCQSTADHSSLPVVSFQIEGTAVGNIACQLVAHGAVTDLATFRRQFGGSLPRVVYTPRGKA